MYRRVFGWFGGAMLTAALALTSTGAAAPHARVPQPKPAPQACVSTPASSDCVCVDLHELPETLSALDVVAPQIAADRLALAAEAMSRVPLELQQAMPAAPEAPDGQSFEIFSSDSGSGWLGIGMEEVSTAKAKDLKLPADRGVLVTSVVDDSPAAKSGLKAGDVITEFDGQRVEGTLAFGRMVREVPAGRTVSLSIWREGHSQSLTVQVGSRSARRSGGRDFYYVGPGEPELAIPQIPPIPAIPRIEVGPLEGFRMFGAPMLGIDAEDLSGQLGSYFGAPDGQGILIREVMPGTAAEKAGLKAGDVILRVDGKRVKDSGELRSALRDRVSQASEGSDSEKPAPVTSDLTILRAGKEMTVRVELQAPMKRIRAGHRVAV